MKTLAECPCNVTYEGRLGWRASLREPKGGVELTVSGDRPFMLHLLDSDRLFAAGPRCDGLLITETGAEGLTCFVELKGAIDPEQPDRPFEQIRGAIEHFAPGPGGSQGGEAHHAEWRAGNDPPVAVLQKHGERGRIAMTLGEIEAALP
jgi:hypothetical protein